MLMDKKVLTIILSLLYLHGRMHKCLLIVHVTLLVFSFVLVLRRKVYLNSYFEYPRHTFWMGNRKSYLNYAHSDLGCTMWDYFEHMIIL